MVFRAFVVFVAASSLFACPSTPGPKGDPGPAGPAGPTGATGPMGAMGATGPMGAMGATGDQGPMGAMGSAGAAGAAGPAGTTGQDVYEVVGTGQLQVTSATTSFTLIPGLTQTITVPAGAKVYAQTSGGLQCTGTGTAYAIVDLALVVDGNFSTAAQRRVFAANTPQLSQVIANWSFGRTWTLSPGQHTFEVHANSVDPSAVTANVSSQSAEQLRGVLTVMVIKQ